jgi:hypothetical protein
MGSFSVYCEISNISITSGNKCAILPIKENKSHEGYLPYLPAALPIFGEYNDYGDLESIEENANTKLIEARYGLSIENFCQFLTNREWYNSDRMSFDACRSELNSMMGNLSDELIKELTSTNFMWIDRQVYDAMTENNNTWYKGHNDYGTPEMLELLGFELIEESKTFKNYAPNRFNKKYSNKDGVEVYSDGGTLLSISGQYLYDFGKGSESSIETYFKVDPKLDYLKNLGEHEAWRFLSSSSLNEKLGYVFGKRQIDMYDEEYFNDMLEIMEDMKARGDETSRLLKIIEEKRKPKTLVDEYFNDMDSFGDDLAKMVNVRHNLHCMSGAFRPFTQYLTPQCGEHEEHQILLDKFAEINKSYISND